MNEQPKSKPKLPRGITVSQERGYWRLVVLDGKGGRRRSNWPTKADAEKEAWRLAGLRGKHGTAVMAGVSPRDLHDMQEARRILGPSVPLVEVALFWREHSAPITPVAVSAAVAAFIAEQEGRGLSDRQMADYRTRLKTFAETMPGVLVRDLTAAKVLPWVREGGVASKTERNRWGTLQAFLNYSVRKKWLRELPHIAEEDFKRPDLKNVGHFSVEQAAGVMKWIEKNAPRFTAWFALQMFAGFRNAEAGKLTAEMIDSKRKCIVVPAKVCKTRDDWALLELPDNLWAWLKAYPVAGKVKHPTHRILTRMREKMVEAKVIAEWPHNAMRHSFCTRLSGILCGDMAEG